MSLESTTTHGGPGGPGGAAGSNGGGASAPGAATDIALSSPDLMVSPPASAPVSQLATAPPSTAGTELTLSIGLSPEPSLIGTTTAASAITAAAGPALEEPRALVTYRDDFRLWPHVEAQLVPRLPLRNLTWRSMRGTRTIPQLDVHLKPFDPATLPKSAMFASLTPALHLYFVNCDDIETYRQIIRPSIQSWVAHFTGANAKRAADQDWCIVYIMTAAPGSENAPGGGASTSSTAGTAASSMSKFASQTSKLLGVKTTVLDKIKADFGSAAPGLMSPMAGTGVSGSSTSGSSSGIGGSSSASGPAKRLERVISLRLMGGDMSRTHDGWADFFARVKDGVLASFAAQVAHYDDDIARIDAQRLVPGWNYTSFFLLKEGLAQCFAAVALADDAALQYDELDAAFEQTVHLQVASFSTFGATDPGDDDVGPVLLNSRTPTKDYRALMLANNISVFDFRVYLAARQLALAVRAHRPLEVARRATKWVHLISPLVATEIMSHRLSASRSDEPSAVANPENTIPAHFTDSLTLAVAEAALAAIDSMLTTMRPGDMDMIERVHAARLELALLGKSALDRIGAARFGMRPTLWPATPTFGGADPSSSSSPESDQLDARITNPTARAALTSADQFASVYAWFLDTAAHAARRAEKPRVAAMLATDRANLDYALGRWADAGDGYARVVAMYAAQGWLAVDRCVLQRQAQCYRRVGARNEYLLTGLRLVASDIVHHATGSGVASAGTSAGAGGDATATAAEGDVDWAQLAQVARELEEPVVVEFAPLFDCELPPYLFASAVPGETGSCGTVELGVVSVTGPSLDDMFDGVAIVSHLGIPLTVDRIALTLVGGETNDLVFLSASNSGVTLVPRSGPRPGVTRIPMVWEKPSTAGEYVAEKVRIEIGKLVFVTNLLKENRKHTLRIHEPPAPVALRLSLPPVLLPENDQVLLSIESTAATATGDHHHPGGTLSLWSLHPQPAVLRPAALAMVDAHGRVVAPLEEIPPLSDDDGPTGQYVVPAGASAIVLSVPAAALSAAAAASSPTSSPTFLSSGNVASDPMYTKLPWRKLTLKAVFESASTLDESLLSSDDGFTVSLVDTVRNAVAPAIEADVQVIGGMDQFIMATVTNDDPSGVLCVEGTHVELEGDGAAVLLSDSCMILPPNRSATVAFAIKDLEDSGRVGGSIVVRHRFFEDDVLSYLVATLHAGLTQRNLELYYPILQLALSAHVRAEDWTSLALTGTAVLPDPGTALPLGRLPVAVKAALDQVMDGFFAAHRTLALGNVQAHVNARSSTDNVAAWTRTTAVALDTPMPAAHLEYALVSAPLLGSLEQVKMPMVGTAWPCVIEVRRVPVQRSREWDGPILVVCEVDLAQDDRWLTVGSRRFTFLISAGESRSFDLTLIPLESGDLPLPPIALSVRSDSTAAPAPACVTVEARVDAAHAAASVMVLPERASTVVVVGDGTTVLRPGQLLAATVPAPPPPLVPASRGRGAAAAGPHTRTSSTEGMLGGSSLALAIQAQHQQLSRQSLDVTGGGISALMSRSVLGMFRNSDFDDPQVIDDDNDLAGTDGATGGGDMGSAVAVVSAS